MVQTVHKINEDKLYLLHVVMWLGLCAKTVPRNHWSTVYISLVSRFSPNMRGMEYG